jgi:hypothetical protein
VLALPPERGLERSLELARSAVDRMVEAAGVVRHGHRRAAIDSRFHDATLVVGCGPAAALVAEVHFDATDAVLHMAQSLLHDRLDVRGQCNMAIDVIVGIGLDLHIGPFGFLRVIAGGKCRPWADCPTDPNVLSTGPLSWPVELIFDCTAYFFDPDWVSLPRDCR